MNAHHRGPGRPSILSQIPIERIYDALRCADGNKRAAARLLGVGPQTLHRYIDRRPLQFAQWMEPSRYKRRVRALSRQGVHEAIRNVVEVPVSPNVDYKALRAENARRHAATFRVEQSPDPAAPLPAGRSARSP